jgi:hypothetical protein
VITADAKHRELFVAVHDENVADDHRALMDDLGIAPGSVCSTVLFSLLGAIIYFVSFSQRKMLRPVSLLVRRSCLLSTEQCLVCQKCRRESTGSSGRSTSKK